MGTPGEEGPEGDPGIKVPVYIRLSIFEVKTFKSS